VIEVTLWADFRLVAVRRLLGRGHVDFVAATLCRILLLERQVRSMKSPGSMS
jgi:hypothetical protein